MAKELDDQEFRGELNGEGDHLQEEEEVPEPVDGPLGDDRATELAELTVFLREPAKLPTSPCVTETPFHINFLCFWYRRARIT